jgi:hypothetical protein
MAGRIEKMKGWIVVLSLAGLVVFNLVATEYRKFQKSFIETKAKVDGLADETRKTAESIRGTIDDLRSKFRMLQMQSEMQAIEPVQDEKQIVVPKVVDKYQARWTYPDTIEKHMSEFHKVDISGKSKAELLREHDSIHDIIGPVVHTQKVSNSSCPGGVCPVPQTRYTTPILRTRIWKR